MFVTFFIRDANDLVSIRADAITSVKSFTGPEGFPFCVIVAARETLKVEGRWSDVMRRIDAALKTDTREPTKT